MFRSDFPDRISYRGRMWYDDQIFNVDGIKIQIRQICCNSRTPLIRIGPVNSVGTDRTLFITRTELYKIINYGLDELPVGSANFIREQMGVR